MGETPYPSLSFCYYTPHIVICVFGHKQKISVLGLRTMRAITTPGHRHAAETKPHGSNSTHSIYSAEQTEQTVEHILLLTASPLAAPCADADARVWHFRQDAMALSPKTAAGKEVKGTALFADNLLSDAYKLAADTTRWVMEAR